ncbi:CHAT domain-containing protein [Streptomyces sp. NPDC058755]|uniref:CHAT domain-containing protein n=1 Tax=Streptomyces sp. NPDC058755 TaxID=3346624 RepID=UPI0036CFEAF1
MSDEESGGVQGLRAWVTDVTERVAELISRVGSGSVSSAEFDGPVAELSALCDLLDHDRPLLAMVCNRDHDEALTLTTAFLAGGARDVVGSRWATEDSASALMMAVFHHYLSEGHSPVDALWCAQNWMLDPDRRPRGRSAAAFATGPRLDHPAAWAGFIHQGHPGPGRDWATRPRRARPPA